MSYKITIKSKNTLPVEVTIPNLRARLINPILAREAESIRREGIGRAARIGANAMRDKILNSPTASKWHKAINEQRNNPTGARFETGTMFGSVTFTFGKILESPDKRKRAVVHSSFGWPASKYSDPNSEVILKDAPRSPTTKGVRAPDGPGWREDPRYFIMQEYGFDLEGHWVEGMYSMRAGRDAAKKHLDEFFRRKGYKK
jgi:hypothetical protein